MPSSNRPSSIARAYPNINDSKAKSYWDYENFTPQWNPANKYQIVRKIGRGKYSEVNYSQ